MVRHTTAWYYCVVPYKAADVKERMKRCYKPKRSKEIVISCWYCGYDFTIRTGSWIVCKCPSCKKEIPNRWNSEIKDKLKAIRKNLLNKRG